jgi:hypothetical protein
MQIQLLEQRADVAGRLGQGPVVLLLARVAVTAQAHRGLSVRPADYRARRYRGAHGKSWARLPAVKALRAQPGTTIVRACARRLGERGGHKLMN